MSALARTRVARPSTAKAARHVLDFYETKPWQVEALLHRVRLRPRWIYYEPVAGNGAIVRPLRARGLTVRTNDVVARALPLDTVLDATTPEAWRGPIDVVISNFPFDQAFDIVPLALAAARVAVMVLLRSTWDEPTKRRADWLAAHPPTAQIAMPREQYRQVKGTDAATHHWFVWAKVPGVVPFHHDTVTWDERRARKAAWLAEQATGVAASTPRRGRGSR